jgi:tight adherence protein C
MSNLLVFAGVFYFFYTLFPRKAETDIRKRLEDEEIIFGEEARFIHFFRPFFRMLLPLIKKTPSDIYSKKIERFAITAGLEKEFTGEEFIGFQIVLALLFGVMIHVLYQNYFYSILASLFGLAYPYLWLYEKRRARQEELLRNMPDVIDMLALAVEAGLEFSGGIKRVCDIYLKDKAPFVVELYFMGQNINLGRTRSDALRILAERVDIQQVYAFTSILIQADKMGASIADTLKSQTVRMREERFMRAERAGAQASQKLLVPMILFIFPIIFIIIFAPYIIKYLFQ